MTEKRIFSLIFGLPGLGAMLYWLVRHPGTDEGPYIAAATFGGLFVLILGGAVLLPLALRWMGQQARADEYERAAVAGIGIPVFSTFLWSIVFLPISPKHRIIIGLSGAVLTLIVTALVERRLRQG